MAEGSIGILTRIICKIGWNSGPISQDGILAPALAIGATLVETSNDVWNDFAVQTAAGQASTFEMIESTMEKEQASGYSVTRHGKDAMNHLLWLLASGSRSPHACCHFFCYLHPR